MTRPTNVQRIAALEAQVAALIAAQQPITEEVARAHHRLDGAANIIKTMALTPKREPEPQLTPADKAAWHRALNAIRQERHLTTYAYVRREDVLARIAADEQADH